MKKLLSYIAPALIIVFTGCEEVIQINLNESNPRVVVEGEITNNNKKVEVTLSKTINYFAKNNDYPKVKGATVLIKDNQGRKDTLKESGKQAGYYTTTNTDFKPIPYRSYTLVIDLDTTTYRATSYMPPPVDINRLQYTYRDQNPVQDSGYYVMANFTDPPDTNNYYLFKFYRNGTRIQSESGFIVLNDQTFQRKNYAYEFSQFPNDKGDSIRVELYTMDKKSYEFYETLNEVQGQSSAGGPFSGTPQNPESNVSGEAVGHFGAYSVTEESIIIR